jgi:hypothetical protein
MWDIAFLSIPDQGVVQETLDKAATIVFFGIHRIPDIPFTGDFQ